MQTRWTRTVGRADGRSEFRFNLRLATELITEVSREVVEQLADGIVRAIRMVRVGRAEHFLKQVDHGLGLARAARPGRR